MKRPGCRRNCSCSVVVALFIAPMTMKSGRWITILMIHPAWDRIRSWCGQPPIWVQRSIGHRARLVSPSFYNLSPRRRKQRPHEPMDPWGCEFLQAHLSQRPGSGPGRWFLPSRSKRVKSRLGTAWAGIDLINPIFELHRDRLGLAEVLVVFRLLRARQAEVLVAELDDPYCLGLLSRFERGVDPTAILE